MFNLCGTKKGSPATLCVTPMYTKAVGALTLHEGRNSIYDEP